MQFHFRPEKAIQAAGVLLNAHGNCMEYIRLLKLLYIAEREQLQAIGTPIVGGRMVAMKHGPLHDVVYAMVKDQCGDAAKWNRYFTTSGHNIELREVDPGVTKLTRSEVTKLQEVSSRYDSLSTWELVDLTHSLDEWKTTYPAGTNTSIPIKALALLRAVGMSEIEAEALFESEREAEEQASELEGLFEPAS